MACVGSAGPRRASPVVAAGTVDDEELRQITRRSLQATVLPTVRTRSPGGRLGHRAARALRTAGSRTCRRSARRKPATPDVREGLRVTAELARASSARRGRSRFSIPSRDERSLGLLATQRTTGTSRRCRGSSPSKRVSAGAVVEALVIEAAEPRASLRFSDPAALWHRRASPFRQPRERLSQPRHIAPIGLLPRRASAHTTVAKSASQAPEDADRGRAAERAGADRSVSETSARRQRAVMVFAASDEPRNKGNSLCAAPSSSRSTTLAFALTAGSAQAADLSPAKAEAVEDSLGDKGAGAYFDSAQRRDRRRRHRRGRGGQGAGGRRDAEDRRAQHAPTSRRSRRRSTRSANVARHGVGGRSAGEQGRDHGRRERRRG